MAYEIEITAVAISELKVIRAFDRCRILDEIHVQLEHQPSVETRNRKCMDVVEAGFEYVPPIWELRVGDYRVYYDVSDGAQTVYVRAVRRKGQGETMEDIIS